MKLWQGRISQESEAMDAFNASIAFDSALWQEDILFLHENYVADHL